MQVTGQLKVKSDIEWKKVDGFNGTYYVSKCGLFKSVNHSCKCKNGKTRIQYGRILKQDVSKKGYLQVSLNFGKQKLHTGIHRMVALAFIPNPENKPQVNHIDGNKLNNHADNLEWCTNKENQIHAVKNNLHNPNYGEKHHMAKLTNSEAEEIRNRFNKGVTLKTVSLEYGISMAALSKIKQNKTYINL